MKDARSNFIKRERRNQTTATMKIALGLFIASILVTCKAAVVPDDRILNGDLATQGEFPFVAEIQVKNVHTCTGFIYSARWVVTSASCISPYTSTLNDITVNVAQLSLIYDDVDEDSFPVQIVQVHPNYNAATLANNIALIELRRDIVFGQNVKCIQYDDVGASPVGTIIGWGATRDGGLISSTLRKDENVPIPGDCRTYGADYDKNTMVCAGDDLHSPCEFDAGVPLLQDGILIGIFSQDRGCGTSQTASIFTKVAAYFQWLLQNAGQQPVADCYRPGPPVSDEPWTYEKN